MALHHQHAHAHVTGERGQVAGGQVELGQVSQQRHGALQLGDAARLVQLVAPQAVNPAVEGALDGLQLVQRALGARKGCHAARAQPVGKARAHSRNPGQLVAHLASGQLLRLVAVGARARAAGRRRLLQRRQALLDQPQHQPGLEADALEPQ